MCIIVKKINETANVNVVLFNQAWKLLIIKSSWVSIPVYRALRQDDGRGTLQGISSGIQNTRQ